MKEGKKEVKREGMRKGGKETARANKGKLHSEKKRFAIHTIGHETISRICK